MLSARDIREFRGFLRNATDRQVQGIYDKEKRAGRDDYAELAVAEAERRGIFLELVDDDAHSTKKRSGRKSPAQLDREIATALKKGTRAHSTKPAFFEKGIRGSGVPGIAKWGMTAGGTGAAAGKHGYNIWMPEGQYYIWPYTTRSGRHAGYLLKFAATMRKVPRGGHTGLWHELGDFASPQKAASAAAAHYARGFE